MSITYVKPKPTQDLRENGRVVLAHGEATGHCHEVLAEMDLDLPAAEFFEEPSGRRVLFVTRPCVLRHQEHGPIALDPHKPEMYRQGDVLLLPLGPGAWHVRRQSEYMPEKIARQVAD